MMKQVKIKLPLRMFAFIFGLLLSISAFAQQNTVKGNVKDASGEPVMGATITANGKTIGITDMDGNFVVNAAPGTELTITYLGMSPKKVTASANMSITMNNDEKMLNEVVVIGYGVAKKNDLTGSVTAIKPDEKNHGLVTNAQDMIQGKIAGVSVVSSTGEPGAGAFIRIRGGSSLNASNDPLIVIDGLAMDNQGVKGLSNPLSMVNPNDIESFTVLKDASATAIYGSRGSDGVIIITTKKGRAGTAPQVSYNGNVSASIVKKYMDVLNGDEYRSLVGKLYGTSSSRYALLGNANTDWQKEIYRTAISSDHNVTVQGGLKNLPYRFSIGYTGQDGILKTSNFQRTTASVNLSPSLLDDHLKFNVNGKFMYAKNRYAQTDAIGNAISFDPTQPITSTDPKFERFNGYWQWTQNAPATFDKSWPYSKIALASSNPVSQLKANDDRSRAHDYMGNVEIDYQIHGFEDLRLHMNFSGDWSNGKKEQHIEPWSPTNFYYGYHKYDTENKYNLNYTAYLQYYKDFLKNQHFDIMGGYEWRHEKYWGDYNDYGIHPAGADAGKHYNDQKSEWKSEHYLVSFYGRLNYSALDRYMLTATFRTDGSSRFAKGHKWGYFPSVALGWKINEEAFMKDVKEISELKLRLGWGMTGQQEGIGDYQYFATYQQPTDTQALYPAAGDGYQYIPEPYNPDLKWETTITYNAGIDFALAKNILSGSIDVYHRKTKDLLMSAPVAAMSNFGNRVTKNVGSLENTGVEGSLTVRPIRTADWQWEITGNATYNKNKVVKLAGDGQPIGYGDIGLGRGSTAMCHQEGQPIGAFWVYQQVYGEDGKPLQGVVVDRDANGVIDDNDRYYYKSSIAPWLLGLSSRLQYKNWDLGFSLRASVGNYVFNKNKMGYRSPEFIGSGSGFMSNTTPYANKVNFKLSDKTYDALTDYFVENASFLKCDNITLGYSFENLFKGAKYKGISGRVYATASNVFTLTKYDGLDPEVSAAKPDGSKPDVAGGIDNIIYPRPLSLLLGVSLNF